MRQKYEIEAVAKGEELEMTKMKLAARNTEAEATVDNLNAKLVQIEKGKSDRLSFDLDVSQKDTRNASSELFKVKSAYEETMLQLEEVRRENKTLSNEIKDIMDQISE